MRITRLGSEWGAAYQEARPHNILTPQAQIQVYEAEGGDLVIETTCEVKISYGKRGLTIRISE